MADKIVVEYDADNKLDRVEINGVECPDVIAVTVGSKTDLDVFPKQTDATVTVKFRKPEVIVHDAQQGFGV